MYKNNAKLGAESKASAILLRLIFLRKIFAHKTALFLY
jgi:hypothetical protein